MPKMRAHLSFVGALAAACTMFALSDAARAQQADPIVDRAMAEKLLRDHYNDELKQAKQEIERQKANEILFLSGKPLSAVKKLLADKKQTPPIIAEPAPIADPCKTAQRVFVRRDSLDTFALGQMPVPSTNAKGASISVTKDDAVDQTTVALNGRVQAVIASNDPLSSCKGGKVLDPWAGAAAKTQSIQYAIAPFADGQGTITNPRKKGEASALQSGVDFQVTLNGWGPFDRQFITLSPYYQTDFRGLGKIEGAKAAWEPTLPQVNLGGRIGVPSEPIDWFWQFRAEYDGRRVVDAGATGLTNDAYQWVGAVVQVHVNLFPSRSDVIPSWQSPVPDLVDRVYLNVMANYYSDARRGGQNIHLFETELGYNLTTDGKSSISVKYDNGTDKDTLASLRKYLVSLNYKF